MRFTRMEMDPADNLPVNWDYSDEDVFADPNPITAATVTQWDGTAVTGITVGTPAITSPIVQTQVSDGTAGTTYLLKCVAENARGDKRAGHLALTIRLPEADD